MVLFDSTDLSFSNKLSALKEITAYYTMNPAVNYGSYWTTEH